jgi:MtN3 and saliva related transmembrane protein
MDAEWLGYAGAALLTTMSLPQIARIVRDHSAAGVSLLTWLIFGLSGISWLAYGLILEAPAIIVGNATFVATTLPVVMLLLRRQRQWPTAAAVLVPALAGTTGAYALSLLPAGVPSGLGILCGVLTTVPQLLESLQRRRSCLLSEVSLATLGLLLAGQALWLSYGLVRPDLPVIITNVLAMSVTVTLIAVEAGAPARRSAART